MLHIQNIFIGRFRFPFRLIPGLSVLASTISFYLFIQYILAILLAIKFVKNAGDIESNWGHFFVLLTMTLGLLYCRLLFSVFKTNRHSTSIYVALPTGILYALCLAIDFAFLIFEDYYILQDQLSMGNRLVFSANNLFQSIGYRFDLIMTGTEGQYNFLWLITALSGITVLLPWFILLSFRHSSRYIMLKNCYEIEKQIFG